ncbi:xanthine dehydrogenase family protein molybdopterin-binding subunit [Pseudoteredinibacter isoporae]|uniref:Isoquinoline 1-oxidoreductase beta subunit n=1 Tax=Pseudoteredinibacter isoporae TaxID=570281 RepID=A0A7X0JT31_9GAMM|nr:molybdopterin cofactor-binding domain-containing protein [Pseudoteredinibacter isoporae]MBB6521765.1 isoquinoline 1-oxidoreductase beta subunit [Pseudoteredinibacter isoporae]NHO87312.1 xanthine dehydrogenase family protein molybdopterin-binding subunit [Pseudoteredinibacter isoporae]NIB23056.1 xanthine dehydrogenase family protein molybdopterin-binding subunit [Pseudoteredinibacter isoporae]
MSKHSIQEISQLNRRQFLQATGIAGSGLLLGAPLAQAAPKAVPMDLISGADSSAEDFLRLNLFVELALDGTVRIVCHRSEMGQGIRTGLPQVLADEMGADWNKVQVIQGQANKEYGSQNTDGSRSVRNFYLPMRKMGAAAREMLRQAAAKKWGVSVDRISVDKHQLSDGKRSASFAELASLAAQEALPNLDKLKLKAKKDFNYIGKPVSGVDMPEFIQGKATFGVDVQLPDMVHASIERSPVMGGKLISVDDKEALAVAGVLAVEKIQGKPLPAAFNALEGVAVIASNTWAAQQGRKKLKLQWDLGANKTHGSKEYDQILAASHEKDEGSLHLYEQGDVKAAFAKAAHLVEGNYHVPYLAHASMEPPAASAIYKDGRCEVWACTQTPQSAQRQVAASLGINPEQVTVHVTYLGGGFGRKSKPDFVAEAALLAKQLGKPVKVTWSREDDIRHDYLHAVCDTQLKASVDKGGNITAWQGSAAFPSIGSTFGPADSMAGWELDQGFHDFPFDVPNVALKRRKINAHMRIGWLRSVINIPMAFANGSLMGELAAAANMDAKEFWLKSLGPDRNIKPRVDSYSNYGNKIEQYPYETARAKAVIERVCKNAKWDAPREKGVGFGLAYHYSFLAHVAVVAKVAWDGNTPKLLALYSVIDAGQVVNPDRVKSQMEGAMIFGTSIAMYSEITTLNGQVEQGNFDGYRLTRMNESPDIHTEIVEADDAPRGVGEPGVPPVAPAIVNALANAGGPRIRKLPIANHLTV